MKYAQSLDQWAPDYAQVLDEVSSLLVRVGMKQVVSDYEGDDLYAPELLDRLAKALSPEDVQLYYQTAIVGRRDLALVPDARTGFEMTLLRMLAFRPAGDGSAVVGTPSAGAQRGGGAAAARAVAVVAAPSGASSVAPPSVANTGATGVAGAEITAATWPTVASQLDLGGASQLANNCVYIGRRGGIVRLGLDARNQVVRTTARVDKLQQALSKYFGEPVRIEFESVLPGLETPAQAAERATVEEFDSARQSLESDPAVRALREKFGATLLPDSVRPLK
jgi:DNA polymerase-3 subunit gamma/tau